MVLPQTNRAVVFTGDRKAEVRDIGAPRMVDPNTKQPYQHGVILKARPAPAFIGSHNAR
jgi:hypothetical protein